MTIKPYKYVGDTTLNLHLFEPNERSEGPRSAMLFFFCGGWNAFDASKFYPQSAYLASRGMVCLNAEVRVTPIHGTTPVECVRDARSAVRWVRANADDLNVAMDRIVVAGGSAAGHVSACCGLIDEADDQDDASPSITSKPDAMILLNPTLDTTTLDRRIQRFGDIVMARSFSPIHHVKEGAPPALVLHGREDEVVEVDQAIRFGKAMTGAGNDCTVRLYDEQGHGFFNYFDGANPMFQITLKEIDGFLTRLGFLDGAERVDEFRYDPGALA